MQLGSRCGKSSARHSKALDRAAGHVDAVYTGSSSFPRFQGVPYGAGIASATQCPVGRFKSFRQISARMLPTASPRP